MKTILIIGDVMLDHYLHGSCSRISPEAPVPVVHVQEEEWRLGGAANVAHNLSSLQAHCSLLGVCGKDEAGLWLDGLLNAHSLVRNRLHRSQNRPTTVKSRVLVGGHQMIRLDKESAQPLQRDDEEAVLTTFLQELTGVGMVIVSDYQKGLLSPRTLQAIFGLAADSQIPVFVDPKLTDFSLYRGATLIKPNRKEAEAATGIRITDKASLEKAAGAIARTTGAEGVLITLSEDGAALYQEGKLHLVPTKAQKVFDVTGAGDTYLAAFAYQYLQTADAVEACEFANCAAAVVVSKVGSATASLSEIHQIKTVPSHHAH